MGELSEGLFGSSVEASSEGIADVSSGSLVEAGSQASSDAGDGSSASSDASSTGSSRKDGAGGAGLSDGDLRDIPRRGP